MNKIDARVKQPPLYLKVHWDADASVFWGEGMNLQGFNVQGDSITQLRQIAAELLPDVIEDLGRPVARRFEDFDFDTEIWAIPISSTGGVSSLTTIG